MPIFEVKYKLGNEEIVSGLKARSENHAREKVSNMFKFIWNEENKTFEVVRFEVLSVNKEIKK